MPSLMTPIRYTAELSLGERVFWRGHPARVVDFRRRRVVLLGQRVRVVVRPGEVVRP